MHLLIADDHPLLRDALARAVARLAPAATVAEAADYDGVLARLHERPPALALLDLHMPGMDGARGVQRLVAAFATLRVAVVSGDDAPGVMRDCAAAGAVAFLPKSAAGDVMQHALGAVLAGGSYWPAQALAGLEPRPAALLTPRQRDVLRELLRGRPNKLIARELALTEGTVKIHIAAILRALGARNRTEAAAAARRLGLADGL